jgi:dTDP-4-dehydrorhamnose reductase
MKILLFGGSGQLGHEVRARARDLHFELVAPVLSEVDISDLEQVRFLAHKIKPDVILNSAAYTAVDKAETESEMAYSINAIGAGHVAMIAKEVQARVIYVSTDYVFNGEGNTPFTEDSPTSPLNVYGKSKLEGEILTMKEAGDLAVIVRTSSLHGQRGLNFVHTMLELFRTKEEVKVVSDQIMSPTWAGWLAEVLVDLCRIRVSGTLHACGSGQVSWYDFAAEILHLVRQDPSRGAEYAKVVLTPIPAAQFPRPATRPKFSVMSTQRLEKVVGRPAISWQQGLQQHLRELGFRFSERAALRSAGLRT